MKTRYLSIAICGSICFLSAATAQATSITAALGNMSPGFADGQTGIGAATVLGAMSGQPAPFNAICGGDAAVNCVASWTFNYAVPVGESVTAADLRLVIYDLDSKAAGDQVALFKIVGGDVLTMAFNTAANSLHGTGAVNAEYDLFTFTLTDFSALDSGNVTVQLTLQGPGLGVLGNTNFNGAGLLFSALDLTTTANNNAVPEPASLLLVASALGAAAARARRKTHG